jgi:glutamyl-tRNA synthetase
VRFAPSPTGSLHIGGLRTALFNYLFARRTGGAFVLRIEDTDQKRTVPGSEADLMAMLQWAGCDYDEGPDVGGAHGPYRQSERLPRYAAVAEQLIASGHAYRCFGPDDSAPPPGPDTLAASGGSSPADAPLDAPLDGSRAGSPPARVPDDESADRAAAGERFAVRLVVPPDGSTRFHDLLRGDIAVPNADVSAQVLLKRDGFPTYHLASVVDDHDMRISHVIRGEEWLPSTAKHALLYRALRWPEPQFVHLPLLLNADRSKISKRQSHAGVNWYRDAGYSAEALVNFVALMGWSPPAARGKSSASAKKSKAAKSKAAKKAASAEEAEVMSLDEMARAFDLGAAQRSAAVVSLGKLEWLDARHCLGLAEDEAGRRRLASTAARLLSALPPRGAHEAETLPVSPERVGRIVRAMEGRVTARSLAQEGCLGGASYFFRDPRPPTASTCVDATAHREALAENRAKAWGAGAREAVRGALRALESVEEGAWGAADLQRAIKASASAQGLKVGAVMLPLRFAVSGAVVGAPLAATLELLGREATLRRLSEAVGGSPVE